MTTPTETLINALRTLSSDIQSENGVANAAILEAALRIEEDHEVIFQAGESIKILRQTVKHRNETIDELKQRIKRLEEAGDKMALILNSTRERWHSSNQCEITAFGWKEAKEAKPWTSHSAHIAGPDMILSSKTPLGPAECDSTIRSGEPKSATSEILN